MVSGTRLCKATSRQIVASWSGYGKLTEQRLFKLTTHRFDSS
jgi:hypothetical protein